MKFAFAIASVLASVGIASAADLPRREPMAPLVPAFNWTGIYLGGHIGGAFAGDDFFGNDDARFMGGVQIGADYQFAPNWVSGLEANYSFVDHGNGGVNFFANRNLGSVTGRLGYTWGPALFYAKGGYAWADTRRSFGFGGDSGESGFTVGGGWEYMFAPNWSAKVEYQYYDFGDVTFVSAPPVVTQTFSNTEHTVKLGVNYRLNWLAGR